MLLENSCYYLCFRYCIFFSLYSTEIHIWLHAHPSAIKPNYCQDVQEGWPLMAFQVVEEKVDISASRCLERKPVVSKSSHLAAASTHGMDRSQLNGSTQAIRIWNEERGGSI